MAISQYPSISKLFTYHHFSKFTRPHLLKEKNPKKSPHASCVNVGNLEQNKQNELAFLRCERLREIEVNQKLSRRLSFIINAQESELILKNLILDYACLAT